MFWSNTRSTERRNRPSMCSSRANALTIRTPEIDSSTSAVSSASRCEISCTAGRERRLYRMAESTTNGTGASASAARSGLIANITMLDSARVSAFCVRKIRP